MSTFSVGDRVRFYNPSYPEAVGKFWTHGTVIEVGTKYIKVQWDNGFVWQKGYEPKELRLVSEARSPQLELEIILET